MFKLSIRVYLIHKLQPPDWNNKDIYKTILPIGVGTLNNKENDK